MFLLLFNFFETPYGHAQSGNDAIKKDSATAVKNRSTDSTWKKINYKERVYLIGGIHAAGYAGTLAILSTTWYNDYPKTSFHIFNDSKEWLQVDKAGHAWTAYNIANYSSRLWQWSGLEHNRAVLLGGLSSIGYQTILELLDAHSSEWGWSWADMGANTFGAALFTTQELVWQKQKLILKFSSFPKRHAPMLQDRADALFGNTFPERLLKDYNGQTYWLSVNLASFGQTGIPKWLNLAVGYGATGMYGGFKNLAVDKAGAIIFDRRDIKRVRQWYLSPDIDWTKIHTNKKGMRTLFSLMNMIKLPAPAVEFRKGKWKAHWLSF
ncbi:MAG TPA: DUF2279 domain-containing protein [Chitinophagaceae bacterium]|nr:DUF2279 domain-containing protein [Chitinophagaceae bacterium]